MWELLREADGVTQWDVGRCWKTWKYLRIFWSILYIYIYMIIYIYVCMIIFDYIYIYIYMYEGPSGHIMHVLAARDFKDLKDLQE